MNTLKDRLDAAIKHGETTPADIARACGISEAAVSKWRSGATLELKSAHVFAVARTCRVDPEWLATGRGRMSGSARTVATFELSEGDPGLLDAYHRLPEQAKLPVRALIESLTVAFDPTYHAYIETVIEHQNNHRAVKSPKEKT